MQVRLMISNLLDVDKTGFSQAALNAEGLQPSEILRGYAAARLQYPPRYLIAAMRIRIFLAYHAAVWTH